MNTATIMSFLAITIICVMIYWLRKKYKDEDALEKQVSQLHLEKEKVKTELHMFQNDTQELVRALRSDDSFKKVNLILQEKDSCAEKGVMSDTAQNIWTYVQPVYLSMYPILFKQEFDKLHSESGIEQLIELETLWLPDAYSFLNDEYKTKSLEILKKTIAAIETYDKLHKLYSTCHTWYPFTSVWSSDVTAMIQNKAQELSFDDAEKSVLGMGFYFANPTTSDKIQEISKRFSEIVTIINRPLISLSVRKEMVKKYSHKLKNAIDVARKGAVSKEALGLLAGMMNAQEELLEYYTSEDEESKDVSKNIGAAVESH